MKKETDKPEFLWKRGQFYLTLKNGNKYLGDCLLAKSNLMKLIKMNLKAARIVKLESS